MTGHGQATIPKMKLAAGGFRRLFSFHRVFLFCEGGNMVTLMRSYCKGRNVATGSGPHQETFNKIRNF